MFGWPWQTPALQLSLTVQKKLSLQAAPSFFGIALQPTCESQTPTEQAPSRKEQSTCAPPRHWPFWQEPVCVQGSLSTQAAPLLPGTWMQVSVATSQLPMWQLSIEGQNFKDPVQAPAVQESFSVQVLPSSQGAFSFAGSFAHEPLMQVPVLQESVKEAQSWAEMHGPGAPLELDEEEELSWPP